MAARQTTLVSLEEYLRTSYRPDRDWLDGEVRERNVGEQPHARIQGYLVFLFRLNGEAWGVRGLPEQRVQTSVRRYRIPDLCVVSRDDKARIIHKAPLLCIEILSHDDRMSEIQERVDDYLGMGVETVWVIDPWKRMAFTTDREGFLLPAAEHLALPGTEARVSVADVFNEIADLDSE